MVGAISAIALPEDDDEDNASGTFWQARVSLALQAPVCRAEKQQHDAPLQSHGAAKYAPVYPRERPALIARCQAQVPDIRMRTFLNRIRLANDIHRCRDDDHRARSLDVSRWRRSNAGSQRYGHKKQSSSTTQAENRYCSSTHLAEWSVSAFHTCRNGGSSASRPHCASCKRSVDACKHVLPDCACCRTLRPLRIRILAPTENPWRLRSRASAAQMGHPQTAIRRAGRFPPRISSRRTTRRRTPQWTAPLHLAC